MHSLITCGCSLVAGMYFCCYCYCYCSWCLSFVFVGILVESFSFFCAKIDNDRKIGNWKHRAFIVEYENIGEHGTIVRLRI